MSWNHVFGRLPGRAWRVVAIATGAIIAAGVASGAPPEAARSGAPARPKTIVDHAVVPAGAVACRHCPSGVCPPHHRHLDACRDGLCAPHCPVRPAEYGFYRTQWRRWPGQGATSLSAEQAATPVSPPPSLTPSVDEESPLAPPDATPPTVPDADADAAAGGDAEPAPRPAGDEPVRGRTPPTALPTDPLPEDSEPASPPAVPERGTPKPEPAAPTPREDDGSLFDQSGSPQPGGALAGTPAEMRYPAGVGRSIAAGATPWRLQPARRQRPADSPRGL